MEYYKELYKSQNNKLGTTMTDDTQDTEPLPPILKEETERAKYYEEVRKSTRLRSNHPTSSNVHARNCP